MIARRTTYLCDQCGLSSEDYLGDIPLRWLSLTTNPHATHNPAHFCGWSCFAAYYLKPLTNVNHGNRGPKQV